MTIGWRHAIVAACAVATAASWSATSPAAGDDNYDLSVTHPETYTKIYEDDGVWVWESYFPPGYKAKPHSHAKPYTIYIVEGTTFRITAEDGSVRDFNLTARKSFTSDPWTNHWGWNTDEVNPARFIIVQPK